MRQDKLSLKSKEKISIDVVGEAFENFKRPAILYSAGKDSTLVLHLAHKYCEQNGLKMPPCILIDHNLHFDETWEFLNMVKEIYGIEVIVARNDNALANVKDGAIDVSKLNDLNKFELKRAGFNSDVLPFSLHTAGGNHLLKTVAMNNVINKYRFDLVMVGVRWDENDARSNEVFLSLRKDPLHNRLHPILPFTERNVWDYTLENKLPIHPLYFKGFRSIDGREDSIPISDKPAWDQDLESTAERSGRAQDKEGIMERLRELGYM
jgi:phosphoadenosine phosphosulfate reductase